MTLGGIPPPWLDFIGWLRCPSVPHFSCPYLAFPDFSHLIHMTQCLPYRKKQKIKIKEKIKLSVQAQASWCDHTDLSSVSAVLDMAFSNSLSPDNAWPSPRGSLSSKMVRKSSLKVEILLYGLESNMSVKSKQNNLFHGIMDRGWPLTWSLEKPWP